MKRLLCLMICVGLFVSAQSVSYATDTVEGKHYDLALPVFNRLLEDDNNDYTEISPNSLVTRAEFSEYVCRLLQLDYVGTRVPFADVKKEHSAYSYVGALVERGALSAGSHYFYPDEPVTYEQAVKILLVLMNYRDYAELTGGYPVGYMAIASKLRLLPHGTQSPFSFSDMVVMMVNALDSKICETKGFGEKIKYDFQSGKTLLASNRHIYKISGGRVTGSHCIYLSGKTVKENEIEIDDIIYMMTQKTDPYSYFGKKVNVYYESVSEDVQRRVIYIAGIEEEELIIPAENFVQWSENTVTYFKEDSNKHLSENIDPGSVYIYNNADVTTQIGNLFDGFYKGEVILRDTDENGKWNLVLIRSYYSNVIRFYDQKQDALYLTYGSLGKLDLSLFKSTVLRNTLGSDTSSRMFSANTPFLWAASADDSYIQIVVNTNMRTGVLNSLSISDRSLVIDNIEYKADALSLEQAADALNVGNTYQFVTDMYGEICYIGISSTGGYQYAYLYSAMFEKGLDAALSLKLYNEKGVNAVIMLDKRAEIDGVVYKNAFASAAKAIPGTIVEENNITLVPQMIRYAVNEDGRINKIDTVNHTLAESDDNALFCDWSGNSGTVHANTTQRKFGMKVSVNTNTKVMVVPTDMQLETAKDNQFAMSQGMSLFKFDYYYAIWSYKSNVKSEYPDILLYKNDISVLAADCPVMLLDKVTQAVSDEGEILDRIHGLQLGTSSAVYVKSGIDTCGLKQGDLIRFALNPDGHAYDIEVLYTANTEGLPSWKGITSGRNWYNASTSYRQAFQLSFGYAARKGTNMLSWGYSGGDVIDEVCNVGSLSIPIMVYDSEANTSNRVYAGSLNDILDFETVGNKCSRIIHQTAITNSKVIVVYK